MAPIENLNSLKILELSGMELPNSQIFSHLNNKHF